MNRNVLLISFSAFFSDFGYQAVLAALPVFIVITLHAPVYLFGVIVGVSYGGGSILAYIGGRLADRYGKKRIAILGNALIPLLSFTGIASGFYEAAALFSSGWLFRNFRTPARRAMLSDSTTKRTHSIAFGFLNALDVGGGVLSVAVLLLLLYLKVGLGEVILLSALPITFATILLLFVKERGHARRVLSAVPKAPKSIAHGRAYVGLLVSTALFGFSFYSLGFPILTIAQSQGSSALGFASYAVFLLASAAFGYYIGSRRFKLIRSLGFLGYMLAAAGAALFGIAYLYGFGIVGMYAAVILLGAAIGTIDTLEPSLIARIKPASEMSRGMGALTGWRSAGLFFGNIIMGALYYLSPFYSYTYAAVASLAAGILLLYFGRGFGEKI
jgi:hypothetical protein